MEARGGLLLFALSAAPPHFAPCPEFARFRPADDDPPADMAFDRAAGSDLTAIVELVLAAVMAGFPFRHPGPRCVNPVEPRRGLRRRARALRPAPPSVGGSVSVMRASFQAKGGTGVSLFRAYRVRARAGVGAGAVRAPDCARETAHAPRPSVPAGVFFAAPAIAFCRNAERRPRKPPLSTFILHHMGESQAPPGTKGKFRYQSLASAGRSFR